MKGKIQKEQLPLFDTIGSEEIVLKPSRRAVEEQIIRKEEELRVGQMDFNRNRPSLKELERAAETKHSNRAKVDGVWYDVKFCKYLVKFMHDWMRRRSQLEWEIAELKKLISD